MSVTYYNQQWETAISQLLSNVQEENFPLDENKNDKGINHKRNDYEWFQYYGALYVRYLETYRQLEDAYDQMVHPQKRILMKEMLDNVIIRMCEVKQNVIKYSTHTPNPQTDYVNLDQILMELKLTPKALSVPLPKHYNDPSPRDEIIKEIQKDVGVTEEIQVVADTVALDTNMETAIRIIQKLERGRQGIIRGLLFGKMRNKVKDRSPEVNSEEDQRTIVIQKYWRAFLARKQLVKLREEELKFLGIYKDPISKNILEEAEKQRQHLKIIQKSNIEKFESEREGLKEQIKKIEEPSIKQQMLDDRRKWIKKFMEMHEFSNVPQKADDFYKQKEADGVEKEEPKPKPKPKPKDSKQNKPTKKNEVEKFLDEHVSIGPTQTVVKMQQNIEKYTKTWGSRDETEVSQQVYDTELAKDELRPGFEEELEKLVDSMINLELDCMRVKYGIKKKKEKTAKRKPNKPKKIKIPQGLGKKDPKDLLEELYEKNIAKVLTPAAFKDIIGQHNTVTHLIEQHSEELPDPSIFQVKNLVSEYVGIPLGSPEAKEKLEKWSWFLFYGPMGTGKTMCVRALQKQTNAIVFDLTPENVKERYTEKVELTKLLWSVIICAKEFQPAIILIDDMETIFSGVKTKKKDGNSMAPRMKKIIGDLKKNKLWSKSDRVAVIACTNKPFEAAMKETKKLFDKKIYFPFPNYATRKELAKHLIEEKAGKPINDFPYETLAHVTEGFTAGSFKQCVEKVMTPLRIQRLKDQPLRMSEFVNPLSNTMCVFSGEYQKFRKFTDEVLGLKQLKDTKKEPDDKKKDLKDKKDKKK